MIKNSFLLGMILCFYSMTLAETLVYRLRVVTSEGNRFETVSCFNPSDYVALHGGNAVIEKVYTIKKWLEKKELSSEKWINILKKERLYPRNYLKLPAISLK